MNNDLDSIEISISQGFEALPSDVYKVMIDEIQKSETNKYDFAKKVKLEEKETVLNFTFTVIDGQFVGRKIFQQIRPSLSSGSKPSNMYKVWNAATQTVHDTKEFPEFKLSSLLRKCLKLVVEQTKKGDNTYNKVVSYFPLDIKDESFDTMKAVVDETNVVVDESLPF